MSEAFLGQIELFAFNFAPKGWAVCAGQSLLQSQNGALFKLLGTTYGGDATHFRLPDLRGRVAIGAGQGQGLSNYTLGATGGEVNHTLTPDELGRHQHQVFVNTQSAAVNNTDTPSNSTYLGNTVGKQSGSVQPFNLYLYGTAGSNPLGGTLDPHAVGFKGDGQAHPNMMPYLPLNFCIALVGAAAAPQ